MNELRKVLEARGLQAPESCKLVVESERVSEAAAVRQRLEAFGGEGWLCLTDRVERLAKGAALPQGTPLSAELCKGAESLHVRQTSGGWILARLRREAGDEHLCFREERVVIGGGKLVYEVAWQLENGRWRPWCGRLAGLE